MGEDFLYGKLPFSRGHNSGTSGPVVLTIRSISTGILRRIRKSGSQRGTSQGGEVKILLYMWFLSLRKNFL